MWLILQNDKPEDFVIATGEQHSVREFCQLAFHDVGIELEFVGEGMNEKGIDSQTGKVPGRGGSQIFPSFRSGTVAGRPYQSQNVTGLESAADKL